MKSSDSQVFACLLLHESEIVNQVLEDMLQMYVMERPSKWEDYLHLVEFAYNNGKQALLGMSPYEALYGRRCRRPVTWDNLVNRIVLGPELLKEMEQEVAKIRQSLKATQDRHKNYAYMHRVNKEFNVGDHVYLRVRPRKSSLKLGSCDNISPRYYGPFKELWPTISRAMQINIECTGSSVLGIT